MYWVVAICLGLICVFVWRRSISHEKYIPGFKPTHPLLGNLPDIGKASSMHDFFIQGHAKYGPIFKFWWEKTRSVSVCSIELLEATNHLTSRPYEPYKSFLDLFGSQSLEYTNGQEYQRRKAQYHKPALSPSVIYQSLVPKLKELLATEVLPYLSSTDGDPTMLNELTGIYATQAVVYMLTGHSIQRQEAQIVIESFPPVMDHIMKKASGVLRTDEDEANYKIHLERLKLPLINSISQVKSCSHVTMLELYSRDSSEDLIVDDMMTFFLGGCTTAQYLIQWSLYLAAKNPQEQARLYEELLTSGPGSKVESLPILRNFIDEVVRWSMLAVFVTRVEEENDIKLPGGYVVPKGTQIFIPVSKITNDEILWDDPERFDPDRFNEKDARSIKFCTFGFAGRSCPGRTMALVEAKLFIAEILQSYEIFLPYPDYQVAKHFELTTRPKPELELIFRKR